MPSDWLGLAVFVTLLAPGFCHLLVQERQLRPGRQAPSALRELASIGLVSVAANSVVVAAYLGLRPFVSVLPHLEVMIFNEADFWKREFATGVWLIAAMLLMSCLIAYGWAASSGSLLLHSLLARRKVTAWILPRGDVEKTSSWWRVLQAEQPDTFRHVTCRLTDGALVAGWLRSFNNRADEVGDRDLILSAPIRIQASGSQTETWQRAGVMVISARELATMSVEYFADGPD